MGPDIDAVRGYWRNDLVDMREFWGNSLLLNMLSHGGMGVGRI